MSILYGVCLLRVLSKFLLILYQSAWIVTHAGYHDVSFTVFSKTTNEYLVYSHTQFSIPSKIFLRINNRNKQSLQVGSTYRARLKLWPYCALYNQGLLRMSYLAWPIIVEGQIDEIYTHYKASYFERIKNIRLEIINKMPNESAGQLIKGVLFGERISIQKLNILFEKTGTSHLLAISGIHISMIALQFKQSKYLRMISVWGYIMIAFMPISGIRAGIMTTVRMVYPRLSLLKVFINTILLHLIYDPLILFSLSSWLSYWAIFNVILIKLFNPRLFSIKIILNMIPITLLFFQKWPLNSIFANLFSVPFMEILVLPSSFFALITNFFGLVWSWNIPIYFADKLIYGLSFFEKGFIWEPKSLSFTFLLVLQLSLWSITLFKRQYLGLFVLLPLFWGFIPLERLPQKNDQFGVVVFNVGQGLSVLIKTKKHAWLYDTGPPSAGRRVIMPLLKYYGVHHLDGIIISHWDLDHRGGLPSIQSNYSAPVITSGFEGDALCRAGDHWSADGVEFQFLHPMSNILKAKNKNSCVLLITNKKHSVLIPGDIDQSIEKKILKRVHLPHIDVLVAAHHGSKYSSSNQWLSESQPNNIIISAGYHNQYHHPHKEMLDRVRKMHVNTFITYEEGSYVYQG
ncbi:MAG: DNA internalization-related competence protein ComEC/Rec2 [Legionellales bacterium]|nr:DNA internalization-related competence protein ComEC/Rec2 [Legionellales bacterium]